MIVKSKYSVKTPLIHEYETIKFDGPDIELIGIALIYAGVKQDMTNSK